METTELEKVGVVFEEMKIRRADCREAVLAAVGVDVAELTFPRDLLPPAAGDAGGALEDWLVGRDVGHQEARQIPANRNVREKEGHLDVFVVRGLGRVLNAEIAFNPPRPAVYHVVLELRVRDVVVGPEVSRREP